MPRKAKHLVGASLNNNLMNKEIEKLNKLIERIKEQAQLAEAQISYNEDSGEFIDSVTSTVFQIQQLQFIQI